MNSRASEAPNGRRPEGLENIRANKPDAFYRDRNKLDDWLRQMDLFFVCNPVSETTEGKKDDTIGMVANSGSSRCKREICSVFGLTKEESVAARNITHKPDHPQDGSYEKETEFDEDGRPPPNFSVNSEGERIVYSTRSSDKEGRHSRSKKDSISFTLNCKNQFEHTSYERKPSPYATDEPVQQLLAIPPIPDNTDKTDRKIDALKHRF
ncbi:hypothetical protein B0A48_18532 [Cryoendolithus antarcticus]|uniref:Uncharacterized protein n=1 Tax=Cryoendolithus antarcticus TaxID=1507870 RepID=A0A1V8S8Y7_9PEZI|nr:hypothetical protein B0A48_18532 [Cryoendolithus antarcticus]